MRLSFVARASLSADATVLHSLMNNGVHAWPVVFLAHIVEDASLSGVDLIAVGSALNIEGVLVVCLAPFARHLLSQDEALVVYVGLRGG